MNNDYSLNSLYDEVKALGFVSNQYDFSTMCGRTPAWFSAIKAKRLPMTADAFLVLSYNINRKASLIIDVNIHAKSLSLCKRLIENAQAVANAKASRMLRLVD